MKDNVKRDRLDALNAEVHGEEISIYTYFFTWLPVLS